MDFIDLKTQYRLIKESVNARIQKVLDHGQFILGPEVKELETALAGFTGVKHALTVASGTDALMIAMMALDVKPGDEIITSPFTFIATGEMIAILGAKPVFADIDPLTYNIDPAKIESVITEKTKAIMPVSLYGQCADMDAINTIAAKHNIAVIEDGAQSFGATYNGRRSCALSTIGCTSFFPAKPLGCYGDGGACFTDDDELARKMKIIREHGQESRYHHTMVGINGRFDTMQAAVLLSKLEIFPGEIEAKNKVAERYNRLLSGAVTTPYTAPHNSHVYAQYTVKIDNREIVQAKMKEKGIPTAVHYPTPLNRQPVFAYLNQPEGSFPLSDEAARKVLSLPMHAYLSESDQEKVASALIEAVS